MFYDVKITGGFSMIPIFILCLISYRIIDHIDTNITQSIERQQYEAVDFPLYTDLLYISEHTDEFDRAEIMYFYNFTVRWARKVLTSNRQFTVTDVHYMRNIVDLMGKILESTNFDEDSNG